MHQIAPENTAQLLAARKGRVTELRARIRGLFNSGVNGMQLAGKVDLTLEMGSVSKR